MSQEMVEQFWTQELGAGSGFVSLSPQVGCAAQEDYNGVQLFRRGERLIVAAPSRQAKCIRSAIQDQAVDQLFRRDWLQVALGDDAERIDGPVDILYADESSFRDEVSQSARRLTPADDAAYTSLVSALAGQELSHGGLPAEDVPAFGVFSGERLCAVASCRMRQRAIADIAVMTDANYRRRGFARAALAAEAFKSHLVLQWRVATSNPNALALARHLGFIHYCSTLFARLREPQ